MCGFALIAAFHLAALGLMAWSEGDIVAECGVSPRPGASSISSGCCCCAARPSSAALSLVMIVVLILLSRLKYDIIWMTANFLDVWIVNADTISFLLSVQA